MVNSHPSHSTRPSTVAVSAVAPNTADVILGVINRQKWQILAVVLIVNLLSVVWAMRQQKLYDGVCTLEYDPTPPRPLSAEVGSGADTQIMPWLNEEWYQTQNKILASRLIAEHVVEKLGLHRNASFLGVPPEQRKAWKGSKVPEAAEALRGRLRIEPVRNTRLVQVIVRDSDPERAALLANTVADVYIDKTSRDRMESTMSALQWLSSQLDNLKSDLDESESALHNFKEQNHVLSLSLEERQNIIANEIQSFSKSLTDAKIKHIELDARLEQLELARQADSPLDIRLAVTDSNDAIEALRREYRDRLTEREASSVRFGDSHPLIQALDGKLRAIKDQIEREIDGLTRATRSSLAEVAAAEKGLKIALDKANQAGLELNLRELQYSRLQRSRENNVKIYQMILQRTAETDLTRMMKVNYVRILDRALPNTYPVAPRIPLLLLSGLLLSLAMGLGLAWGSEWLDRTIHESDDVENLGVPVLGLVPYISSRQMRANLTSDRRDESYVENDRIRDTIVHTHPQSIMAEYCRNLRTNLSFMSPDNPPRAILITSASPRDGKSTIVMNLAIAFAQSGKRVLIIDTDLRKPRIEKTFNLKTSTGITSVLTGDRMLDEVLQRAVLPNVDVLPCGIVPPTPSELLHTNRFLELIAHVKNRYDCVIFDSPPLGAVTDAAIIAPQVDGVIIVAKANRTTKDSLRSSIRQLRDVSARLLGVVLNEASKPRGKYGYYYGYKSDAPPPDPSIGTTRSIETA
jgi:succinoglycan biosynthesis transport protein ExoP